MSMVSAGVSFPVQSMDSVVVLLNRRDYRSEWRWFRLANGDLVCGFYPTGEGFEAVERTTDEDYITAVEDGLLTQVEVRVPEVES